MKTIVNYLTNRIRLTLILIFILGVCVRVAIAFFLREQFWTMGNAAEPFDSIAQSILAGKGFSGDFGKTQDLYFAPVYSLFLAFSYIVAGKIGRAHV